MDNLCSIICKESVCVIKFFIVRKTSESKDFSMHKQSFENLLGFVED